MIPDDLMSSNYCFVFPTYEKLMELLYEYQILWLLQVITECRWAYSFHISIFTRKSYLEQIR